MTGEYSKALDQGQCNFMEPNFGQTAFDKLFQLLEPKAQSIEEGFQQCRFKLLKFFAWRRCEDPENLADETVNRLLKNVAAGQEILADKPYSYVYAIASHVFMEYLRAKKKSGVIIDIDDMQEMAVPEVVDDCQKQCLEQLSNEKRELLARYYLDDDQRDDIAEEQGLSLNALRLQVHRIKHGLRRCCEDCRKHSGSQRN
jgi:DNA-directed RNA polymerase specialized sigma24 family protein